MYKPLPKIGSVWRLCSTWSGLVSGMEKIVIKHVYENHPQDDDLIEALTLTGMTIAIDRYTFNWHYVEESYVDAG